MMKDGLVSVREYAGQQQIPAFFTKPNPARLTFSLITMQMLVYILTLTSHQHERKKFPVLEF
jgi:hypothetical protein